VRAIKMPRVNSDSDLRMMRRCIALAGASVSEREYPFAAVIARSGALVCESANRVRRDRDVNSHAEIVAISTAQRIHGADLSDCTIYSIVEPCAQCCYAIRETRIGRVVYGLRSPLMGGHTRWDILSDANLSAALPEVFLPAPEIVSGFLQKEVEAVFHSWNPLIWQVIKARGVFVGVGDGGGARVSRARSFAAGLVGLLRNRLIDRARQI